MKETRPQKSPPFRVESVMHDGAHNGVPYRIGVWKPEGRPAFVYSVDIPGEWPRILPSIPDAPTIDEAISAGVQYAVELIDA
jgi:hypothetical protein